MIKKLFVFDRRYLFKGCFAFSFTLHCILFITILKLNAAISDYAYSSKDIDISDMDVDISRIPPELFGGDKDPARVETVEWIEGKSKKAKDKEPPEAEENVNAVSGTSEDGEGYLFAIHGDSPPVPIIRFNVNDFYPQEAKRSNIREKVVLVNVQVENNGELKSVKIASDPAGYGFDEAAIKIIKLARFRPGYKNGIPVKMNHTLAFKFELE